MEELQAQNEALKKQCNSLQQEVKQWKYEYEILDACIELEQGKIAELKAENEKLKAQLDVLEEDNKKLSSENDALYNNSLQEVKEDLVKRVWNLQMENKELAHYLACMTEQRNKANTILQEIKEIAKQCMNKDICYACEYVDDCYIEDAEIPTYDICKLLIQEITKAEEE
ncbi:MAG: hypothetical protein IIZ99_00150 [Turicibacter sp.]|nr:hypothetical protein [Turicibacter sp.]